jgi:hypothetical protein
MHSILRGEAPAHHGPANFQLRSPSALEDRILTYRPRYHNREIAGVRGRKQGVVSHCAAVRYRMESLTEEMIPCMPVPGCLRSRHTLKRQTVGGPGSPRFDDLARRVGRPRSIAGSSNEPIQRFNPGRQIASMAYATAYRPLLDLAIRSIAI